MTDTQPLVHRCIPPGDTPFGTLTMRTIVAEYECDPNLFVVDSTNKGVYLVSFVDEPDDYTAEYLIVRVDEETLASTLGGATPLRDAFTESPEKAMMRMTVSQSNGPDQWVFYPAPDPIPNSMLAHPGALLPKG